MTIMKRNHLQLTGLILLSTVAWNAPAYAIDQPTPTASPQSAPEDFDSACAQYHTFSTSRESSINQKISLKYVKEMCGLPTGVMSEEQGASQLINQGIDDNYKSDDPDWTSCYESLKVRWAILAQHCDSDQLTSEANTNLAWTTSAYTAAAATCCTLAAFPFDLTGGCTIASTLAAGTDITAQILLQTQSSQLAEAMSGWQQFGRSAGVTLGAGAVTGAAAQQVTIAAAKETAKIAAQKAAEEATWAASSAAFNAMTTAARKAMTDEALGALGKEAGEAAAKESMNESAKAASRSWTTWLGCGLNLAAAGFRAASWASLKSYQDSENRTQVTALLSKAPMIRNSPINSRADSANGRILGGSAASGNQSSLSSDKKTSSQTSFSNQLSDNMSLASPQFAGATTGFGSEFFNQLKNKDKIPQIMKQKTGLGLTDIARKLEAGQSPASIVSSIPGLEKFAGAIAQLDRDVQKAAAASPNLAGSGAYASRGGAGSGASKSSGQDFGSMFGAKDAGMGAGGSSAIAFEKMKQALAVGSSSEDIYHETYKGSIFDIATQRLDKSRKNVDDLEWESPMNRALLGLPKRR